MKNRLARWVISALAMVAFVPGTIAGQAEGDRALRRAPDGRPDLSGIWQVMNHAAWNIQDQNAAPGPRETPWLGTPASRGVVEGNDIPYQPWARAKKEENYKNRLTLDPETKCYLPGVPRITYMPFPLQIVQTPTSIAILYEYVHAIRNVFMDGGPHPDGAIEWWMGDSRGHWEGDTLVVSVKHFNAETWFDRSGNFHSEDMRLTERYSFADRDTIDYEVTVEDPKVFTRPWKMRMLLYRRKEPNAQLLEYACYAFDGVAVGTRPTDRIAPGR
jgi:hypothetical protein